MQRFEFRAMGCQMLAVMDSDEASASEALTQVPVWFAKWEASLSRFRDDSELSALNRAAGDAVGVSETMWQVMQAALHAADASAGLVSPMLLDALQAAGYDRSFDRGHLGESLDLLRGRVARSTEIGDWRAIELDERTRTVRVPRGMHLDFGGVAKGWAADQAAQRLAAIAPALVDAGGDIAISARANGEAWDIAIADPFNAESDLELLMVNQGGVATSGRDYRRWQRDGKWQHHIIDPRTGAPAETDVLSATVIAPTTQEAEVAAKVALILGSRAGLAWLEAREQFAGLLVLENGRIIQTSRLASFLWREPMVVPSWS